jgi:hypothetical protein
VVAARRPPVGVLKHPGELSEGAQTRLRANWESRHSGADNMGGTAILEEGMDAQVIQLTAEEMQYIESRKLNLQEACMVYDVPPPVVHILDHATFSNITEQMRSMYRDTMAPRLEDVESVIDFYLRPEFYPASLARRRVLAGRGAARRLRDARDRGREPDREGRDEALRGSPAVRPARRRRGGRPAVRQRRPGAARLVGARPAGGRPRGRPHPVAASRWAHRSPERARWARGADVRSDHWPRGPRQGARWRRAGALVEEHRKALGRLRRQQRPTPRQTKRSRAPGGTTTSPRCSPTSGTATAKAIGSTVAKSLGGSYDVGRDRGLDPRERDHLGEGDQRDHHRGLKDALDGADDPARRSTTCSTAPVAAHGSSIAAPGWRWSAVWRR